MENQMCGLINEAGNTYGRLTVISRGENSKDGGARWNCLCECGNTCLVTGSVLRHGNQISCGCIRKKRTTTHGMTKTRLYHIWLGMKQRCYDKNATQYHNYGGRGIIICDEWRNDFIAFRDWAMPNGYSDDLSIDRIDVNGNYKPSNCRWATLKEQCNNTRQNVNVTIDDTTLTVQQWSEKSLIHFYHTDLFQLYVALFRYFPCL